jgi:hypothetical protein
MEDEWTEVMSDRESLQARAFFENFTLTAIPRRRVGMLAPLRTIVLAGLVVALASPVSSPGSASAALSFEKPPPVSDTPSRHGVSVLATRSPSVRRARMLAAP